MTDESRAGKLYFFTKSATQREQTSNENGNTGNECDSLPDDRVKGMIPFPCCPRENVIVFMNTHGPASIKCPRCGRFAIFDYDRMTATAMRAFRGASRMYKKAE